VKIDIISLIGLVAGIFTAISLLPQLIKMVREKNFDGISPGMLLILLVGQALWIVYGTLKADWPIILTNSFSFLVNIAIVTLRLRHGKSLK
jgi:MtN3 and saliva related transmembrane protein